MSLYHVMFDLKVHIYDNIEYRVIQMISECQMTHSHDSKCSVSDLIRGYPDNQINAGDISLKSKMYRCRRGVIG